jgi:hypothetical protein
MSHGEVERWGGQEEDQTAIDQVALPKPFLFLPEVCVVVVAHVRPSGAALPSAPP